MLGLFLPAEPVLLFVLVVSARSVLLSALQTAPSFQFPPSSSQPQPETLVFAQFLIGVFAENRKIQEIRSLSLNHIWSLVTLVYKTDQSNI